MANEEQVARLKGGVEGWNAWREQYPDEQIDLVRADLPYVNLLGADLSLVNLQEANLSRANLAGADLRASELRGANLQRAYLLGANLSNADLREANLAGADLREAELNNAELYNTHFNLVIVGRTIFGDVDLRGIKELETIQHEGPSTIGIDTLYHSQGNIPDVFLRGAGVDDTFIEYIHALVTRPIDYYSCFISYSTEDRDFAERLYADLQSKNVRCWYAPHDLRTGDKILERIGESIRVYEKLLLILSEHAVRSSWVEDEVLLAFEKERMGQEQGHPTTVLFPVRLDDTILSDTRHSTWIQKVRQRQITDFSVWKQHDAYQIAFQRLLRDLRPAPPS